MNNELADEFSALADEYEAGTAKAVASGYEEFGADFQRKRKMVVDALRGVAQGPGEPVAYRVQWHEGGKMVSQFYGDEATANRAKRNVLAYKNNVTEPILVTPLYETPARAPQEPAVPDLEGWQKVGDGTPLDAWLETKLYTEEGFSESFCRLMSIGDDPEWVSRDGRTTVTHHSYAAPTHWRWPKLPSTEPAQTPHDLPFHDETVDGLNSLTIRPSSVSSTERRDELAEWRQAAQVEARLRREFFEQVEAAREFVKRHPALTLIDLAEFEVFLKIPAAIDAAVSRPVPCPAEKTDGSQS